MSQGTKLREKTSTARTIGTQNNKGMWRDPPLGEVGSHFHWTPLNCPRGRQKPSNSTQGLKCKMPTDHRPNTTEFTGVSYFLHQKPNCVWSENSRNLFGCYFRSNVNTCLLNSSDICTQSSQCLVVACTLHLFHTSSNSWMCTAKRGVIILIILFWSSHYLSNKFIISFS